MKIVFSAFLIVAGLVVLCINRSTAFLFPLHASCKVDWNVGTSCKNASQTIKDQMEKWSGTDCGSGEKCRYKFQSFDGQTMKATHTTPKAHYVDDLTMTFNANGTECHIQGKSSSETWYAVLDKSTNYCNLHNLITGSGLDKKPHYQELTSNSVCTQYSSADCEKY